MKIVHVIGTLDPAKGGPQTVVVRLAAAQAAAGHEVHVLGYASSDAEQRALSAAKSVPGFDFVRWHAIPEGSSIDLLLSLSARPLLRALVNDAGFVHLHGVWEPILLHAANLARRGGVPYCVRPAGMLDSWSMGQKSRKKRLALLLGFRKMLNGAAFIHTLNPDEARLMEPLHLEAPSCVIPNGIFLEEIMQQRAGGRERLAWPALGSRRYVLFLSRLHYKKGLDVLAAAFGQVALACPDVDLVVGGPDYGAQASFVAAVADAGLTSRVHVVGPLYGADKYAALFGAACFCLPSRQEGFSLAVTEALACGLAAVVTEACHFPEVGTEGAGLVVPVEPDAIAHALIAILKDPALAAQMGQHGMNLVRDRFTWPRIAERTLEAYCRFGSVPGTEQEVSLHLIPEK